MSSAYGNPQPYANAALEKSVLEGRITAARKISEVFAKSGDRITADRWRAITDELLDHLAESDTRADSEKMARDHQRQ